MAHWSDDAPMNHQMNQTFDCNSVFFVNDQNQIWHFSWKKYVYIFFNSTAEYVKEKVWDEGIFVLFVAGSYNLKTKVVDVRKTVQIDLDQVPTVVLLVVCH